VVFSFCSWLSPPFPGALRKIQAATIRQIGDSGGAGCLAKGSSDNPLRADGTGWKHLGYSPRHSFALRSGWHEVEATGVVTQDKMHNMKEDAKDAAQDSGMKKSNTEHGSMTITRVNSISNSCKGSQGLLGPRAEDGFESRGPAQRITE
jgi:hypothetical protein